MPAFLLSLREGLEAALIIGIVLGAVNKIRRTDLVPTVWLGILEQLDQNPKKWDLKALHTMLVGGAAAPLAMNADAVAVP